MSAGNVAKTGIISAFGALLGAFVGAEIAETHVAYSPKNVRRSDLIRARATGAVVGSGIGALITGASTDTPQQLPPSSP